MAKGIIAKIWNIKDGSKGRGAGIQISDSIEYITNSEKCNETLDPSFAQIGRELKYVTNDVKTLEGLYVGCRCISDIKNATNEMMQIKAFHGKLGGRIALHGIISLDEKESDRKNAGKLIMLLEDLLEEIFPGYQAVYAVHTNTENLHIHFILNTVGLNGKKIHMDNSFMSKTFEPALNRLAEKYGFTPNEAWIQKKQKDQISFGERVVKLRQAVDEAIERSENFDDFLLDLKGQGLAVNCGKYLSIKSQGMTRPIRSYRLGSMYTVEKIRDRLLNKREELIRNEVGDHVCKKDNPASIFVKTLPIKKYKDMTDEEKQKCIRIIKLGRNPWRERYEANWQLQKMADEFKRTANVYELIRCYAPKTGNVQDALAHIVDLQKKIAVEKKAVRENIKKYQPIIRLYNEIRMNARKAYLYEYAGCDEYLSAYVAYKELCKRLEKSYGKSVTEVAAYIEDQENQILYATAQSKELSDVYKTILRFKHNELKHGVKEYMSLYDAMGFSEARTNAMQHNVFESSIKYITADGADGAYIRVVITPDIVEAKRTEKAVVTVYDKAGKAIREVSSGNISIKEFNRSISELKAEFGFYRCQVFDRRVAAEDFVKRQGEEKKVKRQASDLF